jgi:hypothetical protein
LQQHVRIVAASGGSSRGCSCSEQAYTSFPAVDQGGSGRHSKTAAPARQGGPGWNAPDARVDDSTSRLISRCSAVADSDILR